MQQFILHSQTNTITYTGYMSGSTSFIRSWWEVLELRELRELLEQQELWEQPELWELREQQELWEQQELRE